MKVYKLGETIWKESSIFKYSFECEALSTMFCEEELLKMGATLQEEPKHKNEHLEEIKDAFDVFCKQADTLINKLKEE
jgi:hypothetical protein